MITGGIAVVLGVLLVIFATRFGEDPRLVESPLIGESVAAMRLDYLDGTGSVSFDDLRGQVVVVNFWASWCVPCRTEHAHLTAGQAAYRESGAQFVGIIFQDGVEAANGFLDRLGRGEGYLYVVDPGSRAAVEFGVYGVPETFFVDREGRIVDKIAGPVSPGSLAAILEPLLADEAG
ncbi:MAG: redoxin family protein [Acidimicrobiia bacterium]|nr:redoxin family protein [Acidimicrobiia bacterium]